MAVNLPQFVRDWEESRAPMIDQIKENQKRQHERTDEMRAKGGLIADFRTCLHAWIQRAQNGSPEEIEHMVREMRKVLKGIERTLNGAGV